MKKHIVYSTLLLYGWIDGVADELSIWGGRSFFFNFQELSHINKLCRVEGCVGLPRSYLANAAQQNSFLLFLIYAKDKLTT